jgi:hypothetical protein
MVNRMMSCAQAFLELTEASLSDDLVNTIGLSHRLQVIAASIGNEELSARL